jgi:hypothetical protein
MKPLLIYRPPQRFFRLVGFAEANETAPFNHSGTPPAMQKDYTRSQPVFCKDCIHFVMSAKLVVFSELKELSKNSMIVISELFSGSPNTLIWT